MPSGMAPQFATQWSRRLTSNFAADAYRAAVQQAVNYIEAGDIFQVNLAQRLLHPADDDPIALYYRLRERNAATFAAYFDLGAYQILSASPERFLRLAGRMVETRPIKGTRPRTARPEADLFAGDELRRSEKDRAENVMIVDLLRNDLARVCHPDSVCVTQLCELERYEFVQHLVSAVQGNWRRGDPAWISFGRRFRVVRSAAHRRCERWKSLPRSNPQLVVPTAAFGLRGLRRQHGPEHSDSYDYRRARLVADAGGRRHRGSIRPAPGIRRNLAQGDRLAAILAVSGCQETKS